MSEDLLSQLKTLRSEMQSALQGIITPDQIEAIRIRYLGRKGLVKGFMDRLGEVESVIYPT